MEIRYIPRKIHKNVDILSRIPIIGDVKLVDLIIKDKLEGVE